MKYIKLNSLTFWASVTPIVVGLTIASEPLHGQSALVQTLSSATGDIGPYPLINGGLVGIGMRAAV